MSSAFEIRGSTVLLLPLRELENLDSSSFVSILPKIDDIPFFRAHVMMWWATTLQNDYRSFVSEAQFKARTDS